MPDKQMSYKHGKSSAFWLVRRTDNGGIPSYLHSRIMLFRPALLQLCALSQSKASGQATDGLTKSELRHALVIQASTTCISAAQDLTDLIFHRKGLDNEELPEWWYNVFCTVSLFLSQMISFLVHSACS